VDISHVLSRFVEGDDTSSTNHLTDAFTGLGLSCFGSVLQEIFYFKPQTIFVSVVFLTVLAYILGEFMALVIPRKGAIGRFLNPGPFNMKEHASITLMASAASQSALATEALAAQELFYGGYPNKAAGIFVVITAQLIGFGLAGLLRTILVHPTHMLWPMNLPITSLLESLHKDKAVAKARLKIFYIVFFTMFVWEVFPEVSIPRLRLQG
jgi:OPT oligopeptide transporter protein